MIKLHDFIEIRQKQRACDQVKTAGKEAVVKFCHFNRGARARSGAGQSKARSILVVTEMALSLVLLAGAALLIRTFMALRAVDPGFDGHNVLTLEMSLAITHSLPLEPNPWYAPIIIEGRPLTNSRYHGWADVRVVSARYFEVFRIPLRRGRMFTERDEIGTPNW